MGAQGQGEHDENVRLWHGQYRMHLGLFLLSPHTVEALSNDPWSAHSVIATSFFVGMQRRFSLQTEEPDPQAQLDFFRDVGLLSVCAPICTLLMGLPLVVTTGVLMGMVFGFAAINFALMLSNVPTTTKAMILFGHAAMATIVDPPPPMVRATSTLSLWASMAIGVAGAHFLNDVFLKAADHNARDRRPPEPPRVRRQATDPRVTTSADGASDRRAHLLRMVELLKSGDAQLLDVREGHETAGGKLRAAACFPLSRMTDGSSPLPSGLDTQKITYLYCARGVRAFRR